MITPFLTTWGLTDQTLSPNMAGAPEAPAGEILIGVASYVPPGHTPAHGEPVVAYLTFAPLPEPEAMPVQEDSTHV